MGSKGLAIVLVCGAIALLLVHHASIHGRYYDLEDFESHEVAVVGLVGLLFGILIS